MGKKGEKKESASPSREPVETFVTLEKGKN